jgi:Arc/MetJ-type ribon-helix-helix transcriptional regulator
MEKADKVTIRLTPEQASALDFLVERGEFKNRSEAIRSSIDDMLRGPVDENDGIRLNLPDSMLAAVELLVSLDHFVSLDLGLRELIRNGLEQVDLNKIRSRQELVAELGADRSAKDLLEAQYRNMIKE